MFFIDTFKNDHLGFETRVADCGNGRFAVSLFDTDSQEQLPTLYLFDELEPARACACRIVMELPR